MIAGFFISMFSGHIYIIAIVTAVQIVSFKEVILIANAPSKVKNIRFTKSLNWYFLATTMYFLYGESVIYYFKHILLVDQVLLPLATHHRFISFTLYVMGESGSGVPLTDPLTTCRVCFLCCIPPERTLSVPVYPIRLDAYGPLPDRGPGPLCHEQRAGGHDLVLSSGLVGDHE